MHLLNIIIMWFRGFLGISCLILLLLIKLTVVTWFYLVCEWTWSFFICISVTWMKIMAYWPSVGTLEQTPSWRHQVTWDSYLEIHKVKINHSREEGKSSVYFWLSFENHLASLLQSFDWSSYKPLGLREGRSIKSSAVIFWSGHKIA